jgi:diaminopimelate decarboxylase
MSNSFPVLRNSIAGLNVAELAAEFGTPLFVYDAATILRRLEEVAVFDHVRYAQKACSNLAILDLLRRHGARVDATSAGEIHRALAAGFKPAGTPPPIVYTADVFTDEALELCVAQAIHVNCGSPDMIWQLGVEAPGREITLRINPGFGHGHSRKTNTGGDQSKHGIWHEQVGFCVRLAKQHQLTVTGLHMHIGSGTDLEHLSQVCAAMERAAVEVGPGLTSISAGGGLPIPYRAEDAAIDLAAYFALWNQTRRRLEERFGHPLDLEIEPGRYLVAESGYLVAQIRAVKQQGQRWFYLLDAGFNNLARPILYGAYHHISIVPLAEKGDCRRLPERPEGYSVQTGTVPFSGGGGGTERPEREVLVGGPLCESGDIFTQAEGGYVCPRLLPQAQVGELVVIECAGAYGFTMGSNYNSHPLAAEVLIQDGRAHLIRRRQTFEDLVRGESIPERDWGLGIRY